MKLHYGSWIDNLTIELTQEPEVDLPEVANGLQVDLDACREVVGFDINQALRRFELSTLQTVGLPNTKGRPRRRLRK